MTKTMTAATALALAACLTWAAGQASASRAAEEAVPGPAEPASAGGDAQWYCLAEAIYFEARGEALDGQEAVAEVILNRVASRRFPGTVCSVVNQGTGAKFACQFTYTCDGMPERVTEPAAWARAGSVARRALDGATEARTGGALFYHTRAVNPRWASSFFRTAAIGAHYFYTPEAALASN